MAASNDGQHGASLHLKRKRKKSFLQNARGFGKKGKLGHGSQLDQDTYDYFVRVLELLSEKFDNPQDKDALVKNALDQTEGNEILQSSNQVGARVIEALLKLAPSDSLTRFMDVFSSNLRIVATNRFASHVLEALLATATKRSSDARKEFCKAPESTDSKTENDTHMLGQKYCDWVLKTSKFFLNNLEEFIWDEYANHVTRTVLLCLGGCPPHDKDSNWSAKKSASFLSTPKQSKIGEGDDGEEKAPIDDIPAEFKGVLKEFCERILLWPQFSELTFSNSTSALLQSLLTALTVSDLTKIQKKLIKKLIDEAFCLPSSQEKDDKASDKTVEVPPVFSCDASIRLLEACLECAPSKYVTQMYAMCFMGRLVDLACDQATNFSVQRLLAACSDNNEFEAIFEELAPGISRVIESGRSGVVLALCQTCKRLSTKQGPFIQHLMAALHCWEQAERRPLVVPLTVRLCTFEQLEAMKCDAPEPEAVAKDGVAKSKFNLHGSLIVQTMLTFNKPIKIVNSILEMPGSDLKTLFCDTKGCHVMDAFVQSEFVGEKSREKLVYRLQGFYVALACSKHGSRALEALYHAANSKGQIQILEGLAMKEALVTGTETGRIIANKWSLDLFRHRRKEWNQLQERKDRTKDMFAHIIKKKS